MYILGTLGRGVALGSSFNMLLIFLNRNVQDNVGFHFIAHLAFFDVVKIEEKKM